MKEKSVNTKRDGFFGQFKRAAESVGGYFTGRVTAVRDGVQVLCDDALDGRTAKKRFFTAITFAALFVFSAVISSAEFPLDTYPIALALLCAVGGGNMAFADLNRKSGLNADGIALISVLAGAMLSVIGYSEGRILYLVSYAAVAAIRIFATGGRLNEGLLTRISLATAAALAVGIGRVIFSTMTVERVLASVTLVLTVPVFCYLFCGVYIYKSTGVISENLLSRRSIYLEAAAAAAAFCFIYSIRNIWVFGFHIAFVLSGIAAFALSRMKGPLYGAVCGLVCGLASGSPVNAAILGISGFFSGLFFPYSTVTALMISFVASVGYLIYSSNASGLGVMTGNLLAASVIFFPFSGLAKPEIIPGEPAETVGDRCENATKRLSDLANAFGGLSEVFYTVSDRMKKPETAEVSSLVTRVCDEVCSGCKIASLCWGRDYSTTSDVTMKLAAALNKNGSISSSDVSEHFRNKCIKLDELIGEINTRFERMSGEYYKNDTTATLAGEYSSVAQLLKSAAGDFSGESKPDPLLQKKASEALKLLSVEYSGVCVIGKREMTVFVYGVKPEDIRVSSERIVEIFDKRFGCLFEEPVFVMDDGSSTMKLKRKRCFTLECARSGVAKGGETQSGDSTAFFENDRDAFYSIICDGMGSGRDAALTSRLASIFIEKLMVSCGPKVVTLEMLNNFLLSRRGETFTTVDLFEADLLTGTGTFIKAGAAPSFIIRSGALYKIASETPPAGIISHLTAEQTKVGLKEGDVVVMLSDGVIDCAETSGWFLELLPKKVDGSASQIASRILDAAKKHNGRLDDMTVSVIKISAA